MAGPASAVSGCGIFLKSSVRLIRFNPDPFCMLCHFALSARAEVPGHGSSEGGQVWEYSRRC